MTRLSGTAQPAPAPGLARHLRGHARLARQGAFFEQLTIAGLLQAATTTNNQE